MSRDNDLLGYYPDLSDDQDNQQKQTKKPETLPNSEPHKIIKPNQHLDPNKPPVFTAPKLFGGRNFIPPPPPPSSKKTNYAPPPPVPSPPMRSNPPIFRSSNSGANQSQPPRVQRERKNCVYVKNIPKHYNEVDKLMTFFKNEGPVKEIRVNHQESSAVIKFIKEECAARFVNSKKDIFNRSFIVYSLNDKEVVPEQLLLEKQNQETGKLKKAQVELKYLKERIELVLTDKIRGLLFARKYVTVAQLSEEMTNELNETIALKQYVCKNGIGQSAQTAKYLLNDYDWTLNFKISRESETEKKTIIYELQKKYGPISTLELLPLNSPETSVAADQPVDIRYDYLVKMTLLGVKQSWQCYCERRSNHEEVQVQGARLRVLFGQGMIKQTTKQLAQLAEAARLKEAEEFVEILGESLNPAPVIQQQVDAPNHPQQQQLIPEQEEQEQQEQQVDQK